MNIPKKIHYCWFGGNEKPKLIKRCIKSWKKFCPDYEVIEWNEYNFDVNMNTYCRIAFRNKMWAHLSDYVRLKVLYDYGGIYMDTDVELVKPLDPFLNHQCFMGFQHERYVSNGLIMGAVSGCSFLRKHMERYDDIIFDSENDTEKFYICQEHTTALLVSMGLEIPYYGEEIVYVGDIAIYPKDYFSPYDIRTEKMHKTVRTVAIHYYASSWWDPSWKKTRRKKRILSIIDDVIHLPNRTAKAILGEERYSKIKGALKKD